MSKGIKLGRADRDKLKEKLDSIYSSYSPIIEEGKGFKTNLNFYAGVLLKVRKFSEAYGTKSMAINSHKSRDIFDNISGILIRDILYEINKLQDNHKSIIDELKKYDKYCEK